MQLRRVQIAKLSSKSSKKNKTSDEPRFIALGRLGRTHGVRGELRFFPYAPPCSTLQEGRVVFLQGDGEDVRSLTVEKVRRQASFLLVRFQEVTSLEQAQVLRNAVVSIEERWVPPAHDGEFYYYQVIGLDVLTTAGECVGQIAQAFFSGGHDVWVVRQDQKEHLIPVIEEIVRSIDILGGCVIIEPMEGLLDK